ncbi:MULTISPECIES: hypothetical protein [unclassified Bacillus cereus group]|uniref:hypothetical protein n=1 Tax=unclassified Bacillus cereus group TaxID=2750818 RepID=UPI003392E054
MEVIKRIFVLVLMQHILHFRWIISRFNPYVVLSSKKILNTIITVSILLSISYYFLLSIFIYLFKMNDINISLSLMEKLFCLYYLLMFFYLIGNSFREVYIRSFFSNDYKLLRLRNLGSFSIHFAKLVDAFFLEIIILVIPFHIGMYFSITRAFNLEIPLSWFLGIFSIPILALLVRMITMILMYIFGNKTADCFSIYTKILFLGFQLLCTGVISFTIVSYIKDRNILNAWINILSTSNFNPYFIYYSHIVMIIIILVLSLIILSLLHRYKDQLELYKLNNNDHFLPNKGKYLSKLFMLEKTYSKVRSLILKDLLLLIRGENLSLGFIKAGLISSSAFLGILIALSQNFSANKHQGLFILLILIHQMILAALLTMGLGKICSLDFERNWIFVYYSKLKNPYFIYWAKGLLHFLILFSVLILSTILLSIYLNSSYLGSIVLFISAFCICLTGTLSFLIGSVCFPNFTWESKDQINTSFLGHVTENIFIRSYEMINISFIGVKVVFLFAEKITLSIFLLSFLKIIAITTVIWCLIIFLILKAPLWKGWKVKC